MSKVSEKTLKKRRLAQYREAFKNIDDDKMAIVERTIDFAVDLEFRLDNLQKDLDKDGFMVLSRNIAMEKTNTAQKSLLLVKHILQF